METRFKVLLSLLSLLALPAVGQAQFTFTTNNGTITIAKYTGPGGAVTIPSTTNGWPITSIGVSAFSGCWSLSSVTIPNSVTSIGGYAFYWCFSLASVTIGNGVTNIGDNAFLGCTSLTSVTIGTNVTSIGASAFFYCTSLTGVYFQGNAPSFSGSSVFYGDSNATVYYLAGSTGWGRTFGGLPVVLWWPGTYTTNNGTITITKYTGPGGDVTIPDTINGLPVTSIGGGAFYNCTSLTSVTIANSVTNIGDWAFDGTGLTSVTIGTNVTRIGDWAFAFCTGLTAITVEALNCAYISVDGVLFNKSQTTLIQYPPGQPGTSYTIPNSVTNIGDAAFSGCSILTSVVIPDSVTSIGEAAFSRCSSLTNVTIGASVTRIGDWAFAFCTGLRGVLFQGTPPTLGSDVFDGDNSGTVRYLLGPRAGAQQLMVVRRRLETHQGSSAARPIATP